MREVTLVLQGKPFKWQLDQESDQLIYSNHNNSVSTSIYTIENSLRKSTAHIPFPSFQITLTANQLIIKNAYHFLATFNSNDTKEANTVITINTPYRTKPEINNSFSSPDLRANTKITSAKQRSTSLAVKTNLTSLDDDINALITEQKSEINTDSNTAITCSSSPRTDTISAELTDVVKEKLNNVNNQAVEKELILVRAASSRNFLSLDYLFKLEDASIKASIFSYRRLLVQAEAEINYLQNQLYLTYSDLEKLAALKDSYEKQNLFKGFFEKVEYWLNSFSEKCFNKKELLDYLCKKLKILCDEKILYSIFFKAEREDNLNKFLHTYNKLQHEIIEEKFGNSCIINKNIFNKRFKDIYAFIENCPISTKDEIQFSANSNSTLAEQLDYVSVNIAFNTQLFSNLTKAHSKQLLVKNYLSIFHQSIGAKQKKIDKSSYYIPIKLKNLFYISAQEVLNQTENKCTASTRKKILEKNRKLIITNWIQKYTLSVKMNQYEASNPHILTKKK